MIVSPFGLFEVQMKAVFGQALEFGEADFRHAPVGSVWIEVGQGLIIADS